MYLWKERINMPKFPRLEGDMETDVLIIGGGISGILCAYMLQEQGCDYILVEGSRIGSGTTKGTTAALTAQHGRIYTKLVKRFGKETARQYLDANIEAVRKYEILAGKFDFDFEKMPSYIYSMSDTHRLKIEAAVVRELGYPAVFTKTPGLPFDVAGAVRFPDMAQFHPLKLLAALAADLKIREHTFVEAFKDHTAYTRQGKITAKRIIVATHYPFRNTRGMYPLKLHQKRSFVLALENGPKVTGTYADEKERGMYLRNYQDLLLVGGGDHRTGTKNDGFQLVREFAAEHFPEAQEKYAWAAQDCISLDEVPYIGPYSKTLSDCYVMTGFNEWGMTTAMNGAAIVTDRILGKKNQFAALFSPDRTIIRKQLFANVAEVLSSYLIPTGKRCSHLGCSLKKNTAEGSWDCPCHGSRFDERGHLIDNPAMRNIHL